MINVPKAPFVLDATGAASRRQTEAAKLDALAERARRDPTVLEGLKARDAAKRKAREDAIERTRDAQRLWHPIRMATDPAVVERGFPDMLHALQAAAKTGPITLEMVKLLHIAHIGPLPKEAE